MSQAEPGARSSKPTVAGPANLQVVLEIVAGAASTDADAPTYLLGEYLGILADAALTGHRPAGNDLAAVRRLGQRAAEEGVDADQAVDLYLSAAWRMWQQLPALLPSPRAPEAIQAAAEMVLRVSADAVEVLVEGHQAARRSMIRQEESARREFVDDLLRGDTDVARLVERAEPFGLDLADSHQVILAKGARSAAGLDSAAVTMERVVVDHFGDREVLVATKDDLLVVLLPASPRDVRTGTEVGGPAAQFHLWLTRHVRSAPWKVAAGRPYSGAYGIARSYEEAREAHHLAHRLHLREDVLHARDLLVYRVLGRDRAALVDLVQAVLTPLTTARGGAEPLLHTLDTYFATGAGATAAARRLHLSVRAVTYRLARVHTLTGYNALDPAHHLTLHMAVTGARLLDWPATRLPALSAPRGSESDSGNPLA
jgi:sugar diacid utilization regulator